MNILQKIVDHKKKEVRERKELYPVKLLETSIYYNTPSVSLKNYLLRGDKSGIIAEIKRKSPSRGIINNRVSVERTSIGYMQAGASALSVLTDKSFFGGSNKDLQDARKFNYCPILRKDFIVDEYQVHEAKSIGADAILLIAAILDQNEMIKFSELARSLQMEVLLEIHKEEEIPNNIEEITSIIGVNNRDLETFEVDINTSIKLATVLPESLVKVSESGISEPEKILSLKKAGFDGFLIGESFMKHNKPEKACRKFIQELRNLQVENESKDLRIKVS